jgi:hypothetical protein
MSPLAILDSALGTEEILDVVERVIITDINPALATVYERRVPADQARAELRGEPYVPLEYEDVPPNHVWIGNFPSVVLEEVGPEAYPYIAVTTEDYSPDAEDIRLDQLSVFRQAFTVHCLVKAAPEGPYDSGIEYDPHLIDPASNVVFRRAVRMSEAVFLALGSNPESARLFSGFSNPVRGQHSLPWTYQHKGRGPNFWFQAVGTSYAIKAYTTMHQ